VLFTPATEAAAASRPADGGRWRLRQGPATASGDARTCFHLPLQLPPVRAIPGQLGLNKNCTGLAQIARLGPTLCMETCIIALKLARNLGQPCTIFVLGRISSQLGADHTPYCVCCNAYKISWWLSGRWCIDLQTSRGLLMPTSSSLTRSVGLHTAFYVAHARMINHRTAHWPRFRC
jgi:hypothetical protein